MSDNKKSFSDSIETKYHIICFLCLEEEGSDDYQSKEEFQCQLVMDGWENIISRKYEEEGVVCPTCAGKKDKDR